MAEAYVVMGAKMRCSVGSMSCTIKLVMGHGSYINGKSIMNQMDIAPYVNVGPFGICAGLLAASPGSVVVVGDDGKPYTGKPCMFIPAGPWLKTKSDFIVDNLQALTTKSMLICPFGGCIKFKNSGQ